MEGRIIVLLLCLSITLHLTQTTSKMVAMKVLDELPNSEYNNMQKLDERPEKKLLARIKPANFSGPDHLRVLSGKCFTHRDSKYEYVLCPFHNITQEDVQSYYEPYKGILGIWSGWTITNNSFDAMDMIEGSSCGEGQHRSTKVILRCGAQSELLEVTEPTKCRYLARFKTPLVCGRNAMVVYPRLPYALQRLWDEVEFDKRNGYLTDKGYEKQLGKIFIKAGFYLSPASKKILLHQEEKKSDENCKAALQAALMRVNQLEEELRLKDYGT